MQETKNPAEFLLSDKPPSRGLLRIMPTFFRYAEYIAILVILTFAAFIHPNVPLLIVYFCSLFVILVYILLKRNPKVKRHWIMKEKATWIHSLGGILGITLIYCVFRLYGYGSSETDPANIWLLAIAPIALVSRYGTTRQWGRLLAGTLGLLLSLRCGVVYIFIEHGFLGNLKILGNTMFYPWPIYGSIFEQAFLLFVASVGIHYAMRWRRMSQIQSLVQWNVFSELAGNITPYSSYDKTAELIHKLPNMPDEYFPYVYVMRWDEPSGILKVVGGAGKPKELWKGLEVKVGQGITGRAFLSKKPINEGNVKCLSDKDYTCPPGHDDVYSELAIPIIFRDFRLGILDVQSPTKNEFGQNDIQLLKTIAEGLGVSFANAQVLDNRLSNSLSLFRNLVEFPEDNITVKKWFEQVTISSLKYLDAERFVLFRLSPGTSYPLKPPLIRPKITGQLFDSEWPISEKSIFWELIRKWQPEFGIESQMNEDADAWASKYFDVFGPSSVAFLPIGQFEPIAALFVCYEKTKIFSDMDKLALNTIATIMENSLNRLDVDSFESSSSKLHGFIIPETQAMLGDLDMITNELGKSEKTMQFIDGLRDRITNFRKRIALASTAQGDYEYDPMDQTLEEALKNMASALNAAKSHGVVFIFHGLSELEDEGIMFLKIIYLLTCEAMGNSVVHGKATSVDINIVKKHGEFVSLEIIDNGAGLTPNNDRHRPNGIYYWKTLLRREFGVKLIIQNNHQGPGTTVAVKFPIWPTNN